MKISMNAVLNKLIWLLTVFLFVFFLIFETYTWGRYAFLGVSGLILILSAVVYGGVVKFRIEPFHWFLGVFVLYVAATSLWSWSSSETISKATTLVQILGCASLLYIHYDRQDNVRQLLSAVKWAGYIVAVYAIFYYGFENLGLEEGTRIDNEFANINEIGMAAALSCVIQIHEILHKRSYWSALGMIPAVIMIAATQSRKALVFLVLGVLGVYVVRNLSQKGFLKKILKILFSVVFVCLMFYLVLRIPAFKGIMSRMESMIASWTGEGKADNSSQVRNEMVSLGWQYFLEHPIGGTGFGSSAIITQRHLGWSTYLHNNYVEVLTGGGIIGAVVYYAMHVYLLINLLKYRKADPEAFSVGIVWLLLVFIMDWGSVSYSGKSRWYYLAIMAMNVSKMKEKHMEVSHEPKKIA